METAVSSSLGVIGPLFRKLDLLLAPESRLRQRAKDRIKLLKEDLEEVCAALLELSGVEAPSLRAKCWMEEARELSYHIEDGIDDMTTTRADADAKIRSVRKVHYGLISRRNMVGRVKIVRLPETPKPSTRISRIAQFRSLLQEAMQRYERYQLDGSCSTSSHVNVISGHSRAPALYRGSANLVGIDDSRIKLIKMLALEEDQQLKVVSVVGSAGVGKTTLAKQVFQELGGQFEFRAFVRASRKPEIRRILLGILSQVRPCHQPPSNAAPVQNLIDNLKEYLRNKRYFIVIDDLWGKTAWGIVCTAFPQGDNCSRIITTTQDVNVALGCCGNLSNNMLRMKPLGNHECGQLFFSQVFGSELECPDELKEISYDIIRKCCGLPLAITNLASILACQLHHLELWYHVKDWLCSIVNRSYTVEEIQIEILNLSYNSLPHCLKTCLLYFTMYPEGYIIWKVDLVKQWIAEGFINATQGKETEEIAESYVDELINRGMIQPSKIDNDEVLSCTVHHIVLDLITDKAKEEKFISTIDYSQTTTGLFTKAHRLSLSFSSAKYAKQPAGITTPQLRSLAFFGFLKCMPSIVEYKLLRVLILQFWGDHGGCTSLDLSRICRLFQLRYLKVSSDIMVELPSQMRGLQYLETLEIDARIFVVPLDIVHLPSLLHLSLRDATKLPSRIGLIRSLTALQYFDLGHNSEEIIRSLGRLTKLRHLHLTCSILLSIEHLKRKLITLVSSLGNFGNLKSLTLTPGALRTAVFIDISSSVPSPESPPSVFLQRLELLLPICFFSRLPSWMGQLRELRILKIVVSELHGNDINNLAGLPSLTILSLYVRTAPVGAIVVANMAFSALKYFKLRCCVMWLTFQTGAMPNLQRIKLCFNAHKGENYSQLLNGIEHLPNLQEISGRIGAAAGGNETDRRAMESFFENVIRKHPRCFRFNIQWVGLVEEEYPPSEKQHPRQQEGPSGECEIPGPASASSSLGVPTLPNSFRALLPLSELERVRCIGSAGLPSSGEHEILETDDTNKHAGSRIKTGNDGNHQLAEGEPWWQRHSRSLKVLANSKKAADAEMIRILAGFDLMSDLFPPPSGTADAVVSITEAEVEVEEGASQGEGEGQEDDDERVPEDAAWWEEEWDAAAKIIERWEASGARDRLVFDSSEGSNEYLAAVACLAGVSGQRAEAAVQTAMARLKREFRHLLVRAASPLAAKDLQTPILRRFTLTVPSFSYSDLGLDDSSFASHSWDGDETSSAGGRTSISGDDYISPSLISLDTVSTLRDIADIMLRAGYTPELCQVYGDVRHETLMECIGVLGVDKLSPEEVQRMEWGVLNGKMKKWVQTLKVVVRELLSEERRICSHILALDANASAECFTAAAKGCVLQLLNFADTIAIGKRSPEKLSRILDMYEALAEVLPELEGFFSGATRDFIREQCEGILVRLGDAVRRTIAKLANLIQGETSRKLFPGGEVQPLTRYVTNYVKLLVGYKASLNQLLQNWDTEQRGENANITPFGHCVLMLITRLQDRIEEKSKMYEDEALQNIFLMNNLFYIVQKVKDSELNTFFGDNWIRERRGQIRQCSKRYLRSSWTTVLACLKDDGLPQTMGSTSALKASLEDRFENFNLAFEELYKTQKSWTVVDSQLREELKISISETVVPAYRSLVGRFRGHLEGERSSAKHIKYSPEDLENQISDFFEG